MTSIIASPNFESKLIQLFVGLIGMKKAMEKKIVNNSYNKVPASIPKSIVKRFNFKIEEVKGCLLYTSPSPRRPY